MTVRAVSGPVRVKTNVPVLAGLPAGVSAAEASPAVTVIVGAS